MGYLKPALHCLFPSSFRVSDTRLATFRLVDIKFYVGYRHLCSTEAPISDLRHANFSPLTFNDNKNTVQGNSIGHGISRHPPACAIRLILSRIEYIQTHGAPSNTPLQHMCGSEVAQSHHNGPHSDPTHCMSQHGRGPGPPRPKSMHVTSVLRLPWRSFQGTLTPRKPTSLDDGTVMKF